MEVTGDRQRLSDEALLAGLAQHDESAGVAFVRRFQRRIFGLAFAVVGDRVLAEDISQEALLRIWRHAAVFDARRSSVTTWVLTITRNLAIDALRMRRSVPVDPDHLVALGIMSGDRSPDDGAIESDEIDRVRRALLELPDEQRRAIVRASFYGQTAAEISEAERVPLGTAKSRIRSGLIKVRDSLAREQAE